MKEARLHPRLRVQARADVIGREIILARPLADLSLGGCRFAGEGWESPGTQVQMVLSFPSLSANLPVQGTVVRSSDTDMGVRFTKLTDDQKWALRKHLLELQRNGSPVAR